MSHSEASDLLVGYLATLSCALWGLSHSQHVRTFVRVNLTATIKKGPSRTEKLGVLYFWSRYFMRVCAQVHKRVRLAIRLDEVQRQQTKEKAEHTWRQRSADEASLPCLLCIGLL